MKKNMFNKQVEGRMKIEEGILKENLVDDLLNGLSYRELVELKISAQEKLQKEEELYKLNLHGNFFERINLNRIIVEVQKEKKFLILDDEETRIFVRSTIESFKEKISKSESIEAFAESIDDLCNYQGDFDNITFNKSFSLERQGTYLTVDEATALRANAMILEGQPEEYIIDYVLKNNKSNYILMGGSKLCYAIKTGQFYKSDEEAEVEYQCPHNPYEEMNAYTFDINPYDSSDWCYGYLDLNAYVDELKKLGFVVNVGSFKSASPEDIKYHMLEQYSDYGTSLFLVDTSLEREMKYGPYMVFPKQKKLTK